MASAHSTTVHVTGTGHVIHHATRVTFETGNVQVQRPWCGAETMRTNVNDVVVSHPLTCRKRGCVNANLASCAVCNPRC